MTAPAGYAYCTTCGEHWAQVGHYNGTGYTGHVSDECVCCDPDAYAKPKPKPYEAGTAVQAREQVSR